MPSLLQKAQEKVVIETREIARVKSEVFLSREEGLATAFKYAVMEWINEITPHPFRPNVSYQEIRNFLVDNQEKVLEIIQFHSEP